MDVAVVVAVGDAAERASNGVAVVRTDPEKPAGDA